MVVAEHGDKTGDVFLDERLEFANASRREVWTERGATNAVEILRSGAKHGAWVPESCSPCGRLVSFSIGEKDVVEVRVVDVDLVRADADDRTFYEIHS